MSWQQWDHRRAGHRRNAPTLAWQKSSERATLNEATLDILSQPSHLAIFYDAENNRVAISASSENDPLSVPVGGGTAAKHGKTARYVSLMSFRRQNEIADDVLGKRFFLYEEDGMLVADLDDGVETRSPTRHKAQS